MDFRTGITVLIASLVLTGPALAQDVGTATAVNPLSEGTRPGTSATTLNVGARIIHNERIHTTPTGSAQLLFTDHSTMSISGNADIVIDDYVYDPGVGNGHMLATISKGALRYVGGQLSHEGAATVETPVATIGIRGGTASIMQTQNGWQVTDHFGVLTIQNRAGTMLIKRPGFTVTIQSANALPTEPTRVTEKATNHDLQIMTSRPGQNGGVPGLKTARIGECGIGPLPGNICPDKGWINTDAGAADAFQIQLQATEHATDRIQLPPPVRRVR